jgi:hypothetical protein
MSSNVCRTCKHESTCTFPRNQDIVLCEEYEYAEPRERPEDSSDASKKTPDREAVTAR